MTAQLPPWGYIFDETLSIFEKNAYPAAFNVQALNQDHFTLISW